MNKLFITPIVSNYSVASPDNVISTTTAGGFSRSRLDIVGGIMIVNVSWMLDENAFNYLNAFYYTILANGTLPFLCNLVLDKAALSEYQCKFVAKSFKPISSLTAMRFTASAQFEVKPTVRDANRDNAIVGYFGASQTIFNLADRIAKIANVILPHGGK
jgi:hypothetical protein